MSQVRLIAVSQPVGAAMSDVGPTAGTLIGYCARVSNPQNQTNHETAGKLLRYLASHQHWSPFEMAHVVMEIQTTRDIARQILRHRSFSFQEFSQRYAVVPELECRESRLQDPKNRQSSLAHEDSALESWWSNVQLQVAKFSRDVYQAALDHGIAKEVARAVLPEGMAPTRLYMGGTVRSWLHYVQLRCGHGTQLEHQAIAQRCRAILLGEFPELADLMGGDHDEVN